MARSDFTAEQRAAWMRQRLAQDVARGNVKRTAQVDAILNGKPPPKSKPTPDVFKKLTEPLNNQVQSRLKQNLWSDEKRKALRKGGLQWMGDSACFDDLFYSKADGGVYASFIGPAAGVWFFPLSRADAKEWFSDQSAGAWFNDNLR